MVVKHWLQGPEERASLCGCKYSIHCLCCDQGGTKGSDVKQTKTLVPQYTPGVTRGHQDHLNTTGNVTTQAILHPQLAETGTMALSVNASRGWVQVFKEWVEA